MLLLDEPSAGLSPLAAEKLFEQHRRHQRERRLHRDWSSRTRSRRWPYRDRAYILVDGRNSRTGNAKELAADPEIRRIFLGG